MCDAGEVDLNQVRRVKAEAEGELLKLAGVTGVGVGYKVVGGRTTGALAILVYVKHKRNVPEVEAIPHEIRRHSYGRHRAPLCSALRQGK